MKKPVRRLKTGKKGPATRKAKTRAIGRSGLSRVAEDLRSATNYLHSAYKGVARNYYCFEMPMLEQGIRELRRVLARLARMKARRP